MKRENSTKWGLYVSRSLFAHKRSCVLRRGVLEHNQDLSIVLRTCHSQQIRQFPPELRDSHTTRNSYPARSTIMSTRSPSKYAFPSFASTKTSAFGCSESVLASIQSAM